MSVVHLGKLTATPIEIALDLEIAGVDDRLPIAPSGRAEPRISLVVAFASTSQLKRICGAVGREAPERPPPGLRIFPARKRVSGADHFAIAVQPMPALLRLQTKFIRVIEPGLVHDGIPLAFGKAQSMDETAVLFIRDFIPNKTLPTFEPSRESSEFDAVPLRATGITIYHLGSHAAPESILAHWAYAHA